MQHVEYLIVGAGVSGLSFANFAGADADWLIVEAEAEPGGYCRTVRRNGFVWDYSGHFFHFRRHEIEAFLRARMPGQRILTVQKSASILYKDRRIDFPFQKNIHQLPIDEFVECLHDLYFRESNDSPGSFEAMLYARLGRGITEKFLKPYNEKLYACPLSHLDADAMGRFFPHASLDEIIRNLRHPDPASYNATFVYPRGGAMEYVRALLHDLPQERICTEERLVSVDMSRRVAQTTRRSLQFGQLISSAPLPLLLGVCQIPVEPEDFTWNQVLVFNLGFDRKGQTRDHWIYVPHADICFYRVGYYDNIFGEDRMSAYVEIGLPAGGSVDANRWLPRVLADLQRLELTTSAHRLVDWHSVTLNPAYVHINRRSQQLADEHRTRLATNGIHSIGRYGRWTYCSIEDNIVEGRDLARELIFG